MQKISRYNHDLSPYSYIFMYFKALIFACITLSTILNLVCTVLKFYTVWQVLHSQRLREKPLQPWIIADKAGTVCTAHCDCMAGLGEACTHIATLLFAVDTTVKIPDSKTVTQEPAYWLLPSTHREVRYRGWWNWFHVSLDKEKTTGRSHC